MRGIGFACWIFLLLLCGACARSTPEQALRKQIAHLQDALQARDAGRVEDVLSPDFGGPQGLDREGAKRMAAAAFLRYRDVNVKTGPLTVRLQGEDRATVAFDAALAGGDGALLPQSAQWYQVTTGWRLEDGVWRLVHAQWQPKLQ